MLIIYLEFNNHGRPILSQNTENQMKVLMVCLGNICRSPMAEGVLKKLIEEETAFSWEVDSAGVGHWHTGSPPDHRAIRTAASHGIDITGQKARPFETGDFDYFDHILVMDHEILESILAKSKKDLHRNKVRLLLDFAYPDEERIVPDPYFDDKFEESYRLIYKGCIGFFLQMTRQDK